MLCKMNVGSGQGEGSLRGATLGDMIKPATLVSVGESAMHSKQQCLMLVLPCLLGRQAVLDVAGASPRRRFFQVLAQHTPETAELERDRLQYFASAEGRDDLYRWAGTHVMSAYHAACPEGGMRSAGLTHT